MNDAVEPERGTGRLRLVLFILLPILLISGIAGAALVLHFSHANDDEDEVEDDDGALPPLAFADDTVGLMLTWIDETGEPQVALKPASVPAAARSLVRVVISGSKNGTHDELYVANLDKKEADGLYHARTMHRSDWEQEIERRREAYLKGTPPADRRRSRTGPTPQEETSTAVIIYGASWCKPCHKARDYLKSKRVAFTFKDIDETPGAAAEMHEKLAGIGRGNERGIPVLDVRGKILVGFHRADVDRALAKTSGRR
jgi:glutaredoxin